MKSLLVIRNLSVENANAIAGLTWGFPAISNFLGFSHALSRFVQKEHSQSLGGCAVICHDHQVHAYQPAGIGNYVFSLTRNPLTKEGSTAPFNEEARMHMDVSLMIECDFYPEEIDFDSDNDADNSQRFCEQLEDQIIRQRVAGGSITSIGSVELVEVFEEKRERRQQMRKLLLQSLPGFSLVDRTDLLVEHHASQQAENPSAEMLDSWLDFSALKYKAESAETEVPDEQSHANWHYVEKPGAGYLVPITVGYKGISELFPPGEVNNARDSATPFRFVESAYSVGQWLSPHRAGDIEALMWRYQSDDDWYLCTNDYATTLDKPSTSKTDHSAQ